MNTIVSRVAYFLKQYPPFNNLSIEELSIVAMSIKIINLEKNKDLFGLDAYARELVKEFQIENIKPPAKSLEKQEKVRIFTENYDCDKT